MNKKLKYKLNNWNVFFSPLFFQDSNSNKLIKNGIQGIIFTCDQGKENMAYKEAYKFIEEVFII